MTAPALMAEFSEPVPTTPAINRPRWSARLLLAGWWLLIFTATHVPIPPSDAEPFISDKLVHFLLYGGLGLLLPLWCGWGERLTPRHGLALFGILAVYAVLDELLQIPVGRTAEWLDGAADLAGGACGLLAHAAVASVCRCVWSRNPRPV